MTSSSEHANDHADDEDDNERHRRAEEDFFFAQDSDEELYPEDCVKCVTTPGGGSSVNFESTALDVYLVAASAAADCPDWLDPAVPCVEMGGADTIEGQAGFHGSYTVGGASSSNGRAPEAVEAQDIIYVDKPMGVEFSHLPSFWLHHFPLLGRSAFLPFILSFPLPASLASLI